ncbi:hypothetical protein ACFQL4_01050 [Halosimplex aquaticum]
MPPADCYPEKAAAVNETLDVLSHHFRREVINYFENTVDEVTSTISEIVAHIGARVPDRDRATLSTALVHKHLPMLEAAGWLEFDQRSKEIRYHGNESAPQLLREVLGVFTE